MQQLPACPLLQSNAFHSFACFGGINFFCVGTGRELCQHCELRTMPNLGTVLNCSHIDIYTALAYKDENPIVSPVFECDVCTHGSAEGDCVTCPASLRLEEDRATSA
jgi:hypothetical protein